MALEQRYRKILSPGFSFRHIKDLYPIFWAKSLELVNALRVHTEQGNVKECPKVTVDVSDWATRATLDIIGVAGLGHDFCAIKVPGNDLNQTYRKIFAPTRRSQVFGLISILLPVWFTKIIPWVAYQPLTPDIITDYEISALSEKMR